MSAVLKKNSKKEIRQLLENNLTEAVSKLANGKKVSRRLNKKIKKAGKLISEGFIDDMKESLKGSVNTKAKAKSTADKTEEKLKKPVQTVKATKRTKSSGINKKRIVKKAVKK